MTDEEPVRNSSPWPIIFILGLVFLPGVIIAAGLWGMLRYKRQRPSVVGLAALVISLIASIVVAVSFGNLTQGTEGLLDNFQGEALGSVALNLVPIWVGISFIIGSIAGWIFAVYQARQMKKNPYLTKLAGSWRYRFEYRRTPWEYLARKKNVRALKNGLLIEEHKAPLGIDENTDEVVFRYDSEARKHTFMTGASGSGKALHASTWIPTMHGFKRAGKIVPGDILISPLGTPTNTLGVYQPFTEDHYELSFSNGEIVKACGDHLWTVKEIGGDLKPQVISTRELADNPGAWYISPLRSPTQTFERPTVNSRFLGAWLGSGAPDQGVILKKNPFTRGLDLQSENFVDSLKSTGWLDAEGKTADLDYNVLMTSPESRESLLQGAISVAGSYAFNGQTKMSFSGRPAAELVRATVFSLGIQPGPLEEHKGAFSFRFTRRGIERSKDRVFSTPFSEISRKGAPTNGLIKISSIEKIEDNPEDYFCFEVDSQDHMFLVGHSFLPTHNTITMQSMIYSDIENGKTTVIIDFKRSPKFASKLAAMAEENGREFYHFVNGEPENYDIPRSKGQCVYDPLGSGTPTSKADMVIGMRDYDTSAAVYEAAMQQLLQVVFAMLEHGDRKVAASIDWSHGGIFQLASVMAGNGLGDLGAANAVQVPPGTSNYTYSVPGGINGDKDVYVNSPMAKESREIIEALRSKGPLTQAKEELQGQLRTIIASEYGRWMKTGGGAREIDLFKLTSEGGNVVLFSLNSDSEPKFAQYVGAMIFSDLTNISALRRNSGANNQVNIYVDEFQAVPPTAVTSLLEKSRESSMALTIAQQSFDQVVASAEKSGEAYLNSILDTCSNFIAHAGATEKSATRLAELLGKEFVTTYSKTNESDSSFLSVNWAKNQSSKVAAREEERWRIAPKDFMSLSSPDPANGNKSSAVWVTKTSADPNYSSKGGATARTVWMVPPDAVLVEYYEGGVVTQPKVKVPPIQESRESTYAEEPLSERAPLSPLPPEESEDDFVQDDSEDEWTFEEIPDDELEDEEEIPETLPLPTAVIVGAPQEEFSLDNLFSGESAPVVTAPKKQSPTKVVPPTRLPEIPSTPSTRSLPRRPGGLPINPGGGLPSRPFPSERDEESLPDL